MNKRRRKLVVLAVLAAVVLGAGACGGQKQNAGEDGAFSDIGENREENLSLEAEGKEGSMAAEGRDEDVSSEDMGKGEEMPSGGSAGQAEDELTGKTVPADSGGRPLLIKETVNYDGSIATPCVEAYSVEPDLGNVENLWQFYLQEEADKLARNGFVVCGNAGSEFFEIYETNRYSLIPSFITVDSMMHTYHLYFAYLLKRVEKNYLSEDVAQLGRQMLADSISQYEQLKGSEWESAAKRNVAFFTIGTKLLDGETVAEDYVEDVVGKELEAIERADGIHQSELTGEKEDYTQYIPRGYYEGDEKLEQYFKAMMWYGRMHFRQDDEDLDRSALLISKALSEDGKAYGLWESVYAVTSFFAGASDDAGVCEYAPIIRQVYGEGADTGSLAGKEDAFKRFHEMTAEVSVPRINSIPVYEDEENVIPGFRFMGQRFTIDGAIMQELVYRNVKENSAGDKRMLPDVLDVPAALGSDTALEILEEKGATDYEGYTENMDRLKESLARENDTLWSASLYANWLNTLRPLLAVKGEGYPMFMQGGEWAKKDLECFAGSFTELKHDTVLYSKQVMAEMGGGYDEETDDRGYVEPEPLVYARFAGLADMTARGLKSYGMLDGADEENLSRLSRMARQLWQISNKELQDEVLTEEEYEFIRSYGGYIEHFWYEAVKDESEDGQVSSHAYPAAVVVDIATNPNGEVLEIATGNPSSIYVIVKVDGRIKIAKGSVYSFYQFAWPMEDRLTDGKWRQMMGLQPDEEGNYNNEIPIQKPEWTGSYRYRYEWE